MRIIHAACDVVRLYSDDEDYTRGIPSLFSNRHAKGVTSNAAWIVIYRLSSLIAKPRESSRTYIGCFQRGIVITNPKKKW
ncbi:unnamed protein product [Closterium sp. NIES-64]|nr:unnamed protein product [Closterium sp. NIES-64]